MKRRLPIAQTTVSAAVFTARVLVVVLSGHAARIAAAPIELVRRRQAVR